MSRKRVFETKTFGRWTRKVIAATLPCNAALEIERGLYEADLGNAVCKKHIAPPGKGKGSSTRTLVAKRHSAAIFFIAGRSKSDPGADFTAKEEEAAKLYAGMLQAVNLQTLDRLKADGALEEICNGKENSAG